MPSIPDAPATDEDSLVVGPPPFYHRSDCNICKQQDDVKTGSALLDAPRVQGHIVEAGHFLAVAYMAQNPPLTSSLSDAEAMSEKIKAEYESA
jgi:hypothetical protein